VQVDFVSLFFAGFKWITPGYLGAARQDRGGAVYEC
jgi:hypothetical protein